MRTKKTKRLEQRMRKAEQEWTHYKRKYERAMVDLTYERRQRDGWKKAYDELLVTFKKKLHND